MRIARMWARCMRAQKAEDGQTLVEFAISLTLLLTSVFTLIELCLMFYTYATIQECAREGARYAIVRGSSCITGSTANSGVSCTASASSINNYVASLGYPNAGGGAMSVSTDFSADGTTFTTTGNNDPNDLVRVQVSYVFPVKLPFVPKNSWKLKAQSEMYIVQ
jgi:Flp pilus assembly protein TadG